MSFSSTDFRAVVTAASPKRCDHYSRVFLDRANRAEQAGDDVGQRVFGLFHHVCFLLLKPDDKSDPLSVAMQLAQWMAKRRGFGFLRRTD